MLPSGLVSSKRFLGALACSAALALTGCGIGVSAPTTNGSFSDEAVPVYGYVYGGQTPITHAHVNLYMSGSSGYGTPFASTGTSPVVPTPLATYYNSNDTNGSFVFTKNPTNQAPSSGISDGTTGTWACPTTGDPIIYILAIGGDPQSGTTASVNNPVVVQAAAIGPCSTISSSTRLQMNELSTVAFAAAFAPYLSPGSGIGNEALGTSSSTQGSVGLLNAWNTLSQNLLLVSTGSVYTAVTHSGSGTTSAITVTATPESSKLIAIANILAACVNNNNTVTPATDTNCLELFDGAVKPFLSSATSYGGTFPAADDTLMAALYMQINPANLTASGVNTVPTSGSQCHTTDPTQTTYPKCLFNLISKNAPFVTGLVPITTAPSDWSLGVTFTSSGNCSNGGAFIASPYRMAIDASGDIFWVNSSAGKSNLAEMGPAGNPIFCGGTSLTTNGRGVSIDPTGNVWAAFNGTQANGIEELPAGSSTLVPWTTLDYPYGVVSDGTGNILYTYTTTGGNLAEFPAPGTNTTAFASTAVVTGVTGTSSQYYVYLSADHSGNIWMDSSASVNLAEETPTGTSHAATAVTFTSTGYANVYVPAPLPPVGATIAFSGFTSANGIAYLNGVSSVVTSESSTIFAVKLTNFPAGGATKASMTGTAAEASGYANNLASSGFHNFGVATDNLGYVYTGLDCCGTGYSSLTKWTSSTPAGNTTALYTSASQYLAGINGVRALTLDGADNVWIGNTFASVGDATATGNFAVSEVATAGSGTSATFTALSPNGSAPSTCETLSSTTTHGCPDGGGFIKSAFIEARDIAVDPSGSVWVLQTANQASGTSAENFVGNSITQMVGSAVPVITPLSVATKNNKSATKP